MTSTNSSDAVAVELFSTSILSNHKVRTRHERYTSVLQIKKVSRQSSSELVRIGVIA